MNKIYIKKSSIEQIKNFLPILLYILIFCMVCVVFNGWIQLGIQLAIFFFFLLYCCPLMNREGEDFSLIFIFPLILSVFQNIWLGLLAKHLTVLNLQVYLSFNILFATLMIGYYCIKYTICKDVLIYLSLLFILVCYSVILYFFYPAKLTSWVASLRNIIAPFLFLIYGRIFAKKITIHKIMDYILLIGLIVILFGLYESFINPNVWLKFNVTELWLMKGITPSESGLPANFYSSESFFGMSFIQRMSSTFADPVNLGTFLLCVFFVSYYKKNYLILILSLLACVLTISKGALLGVLVFACIWMYFKDKSKIVFLVTLISAILLGVLFLIYSKSNSSGSVFVHLFGFFGSFENILYYPLGMGCGNVGVLSTILGSPHNSSIIESGLGAIIGELGILGLIIYLLFFALIFRNLIVEKQERLKIVALSLLCSIFANIMFNEVALSPNSCGIYFCLLGLMCSSTLKKPIRIRQMNRGEGCYVN